MYKYHKIRDLREDKDLTQIECAKLFFVSKNTYIRYETGERIPPIDFMERVADYYKVTLDYLAGRSNEKWLLKKCTKEHNSKKI